MAERQFPDILNEMLNHDYQWHLSDQNESRSIVSWSGEPNFNPRRKINTSAQMLPPSGPRIIQPHVRGIFHHGKHSSHTTPEIAFNCHCSTDFRNQTYQMTQNCRYANHTTHLGQQVCHVITKAFTVRDLFGQTAHLIALFLISIIITIYITLT